MSNNMFVEGLSDEGIADDNFYNVDIADEISDGMISDFEPEYFWGKKQVAKRKARRSDRKAKGKTVKQRLSKFGQKLSEKGINPFYAPLIPFKGVMRSLLTKKGISNPPRKIAPLAKMFHEKFVQKRGEENFAVAVPALISAIVTFLKSVKDKVENDPENATPIEIDFAKKIVQVEREVETQAGSLVDEGIGSQIRGFVSSPWGIFAVIMSFGLITYGAISIFKK